MPMLLNLVDHHNVVHFYESGFAEDAYRSTQMLNLLCLALFMALLATIVPVNNVLQKRWYVAFPLTSANFDSTEV